MICVARTSSAPRKILRLGVGVVGPAAVWVLYNELRFGTLFDRSQQLHYVQDSYRFQRPPGQFSPAHVPFNLYSWFLLGPQFQANFPYVKLGILGTALPLTSPAFGWAPITSSAGRIVSG